MSRNEFKQIESLENINQSNKDSVFICWSSHELRCIASSQILSKKYQLEYAFIIVYTHKNDRRIKNLEIIRNNLKKFVEIKEIYIDENIPIPVLKEFSQKIYNIVKENEDSIITIDISTAIKWHLLIFLKFLDSLRLLNQIRFIYSEPRDYNADLFQPLSFGLREIFPIPLYSGIYNFNQEDLLVLILGYEGNRSVALYENIDPSETLLLIADPPYNPEWKGRSEEMNQQVINLVGKDKIRYIDSRDPFVIKNQLEVILSKYPNYNHFISPLGPKPQIIGLYLYIRECKVKPNLIYCAPLRHNELFYSDGIGKIWQIRT